MSLVEMTLESRFLNGNTRISVYLPDCPRNEDIEAFYASGKKYPVLWLLHGTGGDHSDWMRRSMVEIYARERQLICVMPSALNSDYVDWPNFALGYDMWNYFLLELMPMVQHWFPASSRREDNFIAGLSMGGSGALKFILNNSDLFAAGAILSWVPFFMGEMDDTGVLGRETLRWRNQVANKGGYQALRKSAENSWDQILKMNSEHKLPKLLFTMGTEDFLYDYYVSFHEMCVSEKIPVCFELVPGYGHEWRFWDQAIEKAMDFFGIPKIPAADSWRGLRSRGKI